MPSNVQHVRVGMTLREQWWWKPGIDGVVMDVRMSRMGDPHLIVYVALREIRVGDKIAGSHGVKFTVGEIIPLADMPELINEKTGEKLMPNLLLSTKNLTRGLGGMIREMAAVTNLFESVHSFRTWPGIKPSRVFSFEEQKEVEPHLPTGILTMYGNPLAIKEKDGSTRTIKASYGIMRLLQLRHLSGLKHHYPSTTFLSMTVPKGRYRQGTPRLGEGELMSMMMQSLPCNVRDALNSSDMCSVTLCSASRRIVINCDCQDKNAKPIEVQMRYATALLDVFSTVAMLNTPDRPQIALRYFTQT